MLVTRRMGLNSNILCPSDEYPANAIIKFRTNGPRFPHPPTNVRAKRKSNDDGHWPKIESVGSLVIMPIGLPFLLLLLSSLATISSSSSSSSCPGGGRPHQAVLPLRAGGHPRRRALRQGAGMPAGDKAGLVQDQGGGGHAVAVPV